MTFACLLLAAQPALAQLPQQEYRGVTETGLLLRKLSSDVGVLVIGAHPDDEDNQLLSYLSLGEGARVSYLSLTRGEGGQNSIGTELGPALGVLRTGELLSARNVDNSEQYFTRAYDFGFSKNAEETFRHWPRDSILGDVVAVVRRVRPDVIVAIFSGTPRDGHGQHQVSGMLAREAFVAAADPARFPEQIRSGLRPHQAAKLVQATGYRQAEPTEVLATGRLDPLYGRSYAQLGALSRSRHRSQDMGQAEALGPRSTSIRVLEPQGDSVLLHGLANRRPKQFKALLQQAQQSLSAYNSERVAELLSQAASDSLAAHERELLNRALLSASGVVLDATANTELLVPGTTVDLTVRVWNAGARALRVLRVTPEIPQGWSMEGGDSAAARTIQRDSMATWQFKIRVPLNAELSQPYFLREPRLGDYYAWPTGTEVAGQPFDRAPLGANIDLVSGDVRMTRSITATRQIVDPRAGESRRAIHVVPAFALRPEPATAVLTMQSLSGAKRSIDVSAELLSNGAGGSITVRPVLPAGWRATPHQVALVLRGAGDVATARFAVEPPRSVAPGQYALRFVGTDSAGRGFDLTQRVIDYPHIENRVLFEPAIQNVTVLDARFARGIRVGYVIGVDPQVPQMLEQLGVLVERLDEAQLANAQLGIYDAVVIGSRAYEVRPDLVAHNARLLDYARKGGNLITLYQQYEFIQGKYAPYELTLARPHTRITDEASPVLLLDSTARALRGPNRITARDFEGWVQERALYMPNTWAPEYKPLLEMNDPGESAQRGAVLVAPLGSGLYTYTGIAFFRQIPAGVPGALRLFINLLSMGIKDVAF